MISTGGGGVLVRQAERRLRLADTLAQHAGSGTRSVLRGRALPSLRPLQFVPVHPLVDQHLGEQSLADLLPLVLDGCSAIDRVERSMRVASVQTEQSGREESLNADGEALRRLAETDRSDSPTASGPISWTSRAKRPPGPPDGPRAAPGRGCTKMAGLKPAVLNPRRADPFLCSRSSSGRSPPVVSLRAPQLVELLEIDPKLAQDSEDAPEA